MENQEQIEQEAPQQDRRELLSQQFDAIQAEQPVNTPQTAEKITTASRERDESGKFVSKGDKPQARAAQTTASQGEVEEAPVEEPVWKRPPASWKKDYHEVWATADPRLQEYAYQREEQMKAGVQPLLEKAQFADQMREAIEPYIPTIRGLGIEPQDAVKKLMEADHNLRYGTPQQKFEIFTRLAQQYGVNLNESHSPSQQAMVDPMLSALQHELNSVRGEVLTWKQQQEQAQNQQLLGEIEQFSQKAEYFEQARPTMIQLLQSGVATTLQEAYDKAVRLNDELFETVQQAQQAKLEAEKRAAADRAAKSARAAAVSVRSATPGVPTTTKAQDRRTLLAEQFDGMANRL